MGKRGVHSNVSIPGTGISHRARLDRPQSASKARVAQPDPEPQLSAFSIRALPDGVIDILDERQQPAEGETAKLVRQRFKSDILEYLEKVAVERNEASSLDVHSQTPAPGIGSERLDFPVPRPAKPTDPREFHAGSSAHVQATEEWGRYMEQLARWRAAKADWEKASGHPPPDKAAVLAATEARLSAMNWPRETIVSLELLNGGAVAVCDVDLPEIEMLPSSEWSVDRTALRLVRRNFSPAALRKTFERHVHSVLFRLIGEIFASSSAIQEVRAAGYTQRQSTATGNIEDVYILAVTASRSEWQAINFTNLECIDPVAALARFGREASSSSRSAMGPIRPSFLR
jgi:hypothetical protein